MSLINFRNHNLSNDIEINNGLYFHENKWLVQWSQSEHTTMSFENINLDSTPLTDHLELLSFVKIMTYYNFPKKVNLNISSWSTSQAKHKAAIYFAKYFLWPNQLLTAKSISSVTLKQLQSFAHTILERLNLDIEGSATLFRFFLGFLEDWSNFTRMKILPKKYELDINVSLILSEAQLLRANKKIDESSNPWQPMDPNDIEVIYKEAHRYIYEYAPCIIKCQSLIVNRRRVGLGNKKALGQVRKDGATKELFKTLKNMNVPMIDQSRKIFNFTPVTKKVRSLGYACGWQDRTTIKVSEVRPAVITLKRLCIFIIALFTGMRRREIAELKVNCAIFRGDEPYLSITRFKQADDSTSEGEPDQIPVPKIVHDAVEVLIPLFERNRALMASNYLLLSDIYTRKQYEKIKIATVGKDISRIVMELVGVQAHVHQLRKTIAWLLISRSEANVDLIRQLLGHKSYGMTLRYILRNSLIVDSAMRLIEHNYTEDLNTIFQSIADGKTVGSLSNNIRKRIKNQCYKGQVLVTDIESFVSSALKTGIPMFVSKLPIGGFCIKVGGSATVPPCMSNGRGNNPQIDFCNYKVCSFVLHNDESITNIKSQISYYQNKLKYSQRNMNKRVISYYKREIIEHELLLKNLKKEGPGDRKEGFNA